MMYVVGGFAVVVVLGMIMQNFTAVVEFVGKIMVIVAMIAALMFGLKYASRVVDGQTSSVEAPAAQQRA